MAGKGVSASTVPFYESRGGVGGKFEKRSLRRSRATPYDRPHTANGKNSWVSKVIVDPAKKLIACSARRFFSSVFQNRLPLPSPTLPLPPPDDLTNLLTAANPELSSGLQDPVLQNKALQSSDAHSHYVTTEGSNMPTELLQLFKQNNFTRPEADHLLKLLESKARNLPVADDARRVESSLSKPTKQYVEDSSENIRSHAALEEDIMFPAELAREYMGSRFSKGSPSMSSFHNQATIEDGDISNDVPSAPSSRRTSFAIKIFNHGNDGENDLTTPRFRARSSLHKMASSRIHASPFSKVSGSTRKLASPTLLKQDGELGWKAPSRKRSSAVLDDIGSVDEIRRIRRKHGLTLPLGKKYSSGHVEPFSLTHKRSFMDDWRLGGSKPAGGVEDTNGTSTRFSHLPSMSSEPAAKVLQNLENMAPKVKLVEAKLNTARQRTPFKLTEDMLCGKALKSIASIDSLKLLQGTQNEEKLEGNSRDLDFTSQKQNGAEENGPEKSCRKFDITSQKQNQAEEIGPEKSHLQPDFTYQKHNGAKENGLGKDHLQLDFTYQKQNGAEETDPEKTHRQLDTTLSVDNRHILQSSIPSSTTISVAQKKHAFMMSIPEDFLFLDEDEYCNGPAAESLLTERGESKTLVAEGNPTPPGKLILDKSPVLFETKKAHLELATVSENSCVSVSGDGTTASLTFPLLVTPLQSGLRSPSPFSLEKSKDVESSSASALEVSHPWMCPEPVKPIRIGDAADLSLQVSESGECKGNLSQEGANAKSILPGSSYMHNGLVHSSPSTILPSPFLASAGFGNQASADASSTSGSAVSTPIAIHTSATSSSLTWPALQPSVPLVSTFQFGSSDKTSPASESAASFAEASFTKQDVDKEVNAISASMPPVGSTSLALASTGSGLLGLGSHTYSSTDKSQPQNAGSGSMFRRQSSEVVSGAETASQSILFQFGSSAANSTGTSGVSSLIANTASFSSSFGLSSSSSSLETKSVTFESGSSPSMFTFGSTVSAVSSGANAVSSSSGSMPNVFSFGAGSSSTYPAINAFTSSSSVTPGMFNFGATSSSNMSSSSSASTFSTSFSSVTNVASTSTASSTIFGSTLQNQISAPFSGTFSASPSSGFTFGASSSFTAPNIPVMTFGATISSTAPGSVSSFATPSSSPSLFPTPSAFTNPSTFMAAGNHDQMNAEDSMAEDPVQSPITGVPGLGQQPVSSPAGFPFGSTAQPVASPFQFGGQQNQVALQNNVFQGSGSLEFNAGGSFSLGSVGGEDKSGRKYVKVNRNRHRKK